MEMTMDANELARLRKVAEAATPGPWIHETHGNGFAPLVVGNGMAVAETFDKPHLLDATHITTFDPPTVLALLAEIERLQDVRGENPLGEMLRVQEIERQRDAARAERDAATDSMLTWQARAKKGYAEVERLIDTEKVQGAMIRELEDENTELNDELGTAVQVLKARLAAVEALLDRMQPLWRHKGCWLTTQTVLAVDLRAALAEGDA